MDSEAGSIWADWAGLLFPVALLAKPKISINWVTAIANDVTGERCTIRLLVFLFALGSIVHAPP
jgi:hypothetical protein